MSGTEPSHAEVAVRPPAAEPEAGPPLPAAVSANALLERMIAHAAWANERVLASLRALPEPPAEAVRLLAHVLEAERLHLERAAGADPFPQDFWPARTLEECAAQAAENRERLAAFVAALPAEALARPASYRDSRGNRHRTPVADLLAHIGLHGSHHRGQIARLVRAAGGEPAVTDYLAFVRANP
ncbi:MAG TPA: DinB family protein [Longimicrobiales bacterium]|nr:DinB family protein [Longimicrobiales bacterium]